MLHPERDQKVHSGELAPNDQVAELNFFCNSIPPICVCFAVYVWQGCKPLRGSHSPSRVKQPKTVLVHPTDQKLPITSAF